MHDGDKGDEPATLGAFGYFAAIVLCCLIVGGLTYSLGRENERRYETPASYAKSAKADAQSACAGREGAAAFECIYEKVESAQEQARGEQDLSAQQKAANAAIISAFVAFATLILSGVGVWYVKRTLDATLKAVEDTGKATLAMQRSNDIAESSNRPLMALDLENSTVEFPPFDPPWNSPVHNLSHHFRATLRLTNVGSQPCWIKAIWISVIPVPIDGGNRKCPDYANDHFRDAISGFINVGKHIDVGGGFYTISPDQFALLGNGFVPMITVLCQYQGTSGQIFSTRFGYYLLPNSTCMNYPSMINADPVENQTYWRDGRIKSVKLDLHHSIEYLD